MGIKKETINVFPVDTPNLSCDELAESLLNTYRIIADSGVSTKDAIDNILIASHVWR